MHGRRVAERGSTEPRPQEALQEPLRALLVHLGAGVRRTMPAQPPHLSWSRKGRKQDLSESLPMMSDVIQCQSR